MHVNQVTSITRLATTIALVSISSFSFFPNEAIDHFIFIYSHSIHWLHWALIRWLIKWDFSVHNMWLFIQYMFSLHGLSIQWLFSLYCVGSTSVLIRDHWHHHGAPEHPSPSTAVGLFINLLLLLVTCSLIIIHCSLFLVHSVFNSTQSRV